MKKCFVDLKRLPENVNKKCLGKAKLMNESRVEEHEDLNDDVSQSAFFLFDIRNFVTKIFSVNFETPIDKMLVKMT